VRSLHKFRSANDYESISQNNGGKMSIVIKNLTLWPLIIPLNSGTNLRLSPGEVSHEIDDVEIRGNPKTEKLLRQRAIEKKER
jgi:hypothetical protein